LVADPVEAFFCPVWDKWLLILLKKNFIFIELKKKSEKIVFFVYFCGIIFGK